MHQSSSYRDFSEEFRGKIKISVSTRFLGDAKSPQPETYLQKNGNILAFEWAYNQLNRFINKKVIQV